MASWDRSNGIWWHYHLERNDQGYHRACLISDHEPVIVAPSEEQELPAP